MYQSNDGLILYRRGEGMYKRWIRFQPLSDSYQFAPPLLQGEKTARKRKVFIEQIKATSRAGKVF
jgi:hypothetical protein